MTIWQHRILTLVVLAGIVVSVLACGRKTDPLVPASPRPEQIKEIKIVARGPAAFLSWPIPVKNIEGKDITPGEIKTFQVFRAEIERDRKKARYKKVAEIDLANPAPAEVRNGTVFWTDANLQYQQTYGYRIRAESARGGVSVPSEEVRVSPLLSLSAPQNLDASAGDTQITLTWKPVTTQSDGSAYTGFIGYNIYRGTGPGREGEEPLNREPLTKATYKDTSVLNNRKYYYTVRAVDNPERPWKESLDSLEASAVPRDMTPPLRPAGLTVVPGVERIFLTWNENQETDLAGYNVYRSRRSGRGYERLTDKPVNRTTFSDETVKPGIQYYYAVAAVDQAGNESRLSREETGFAEKMR